MSYSQAHNDNQDSDLHVLDILNEMRHQGLESAFIRSLMDHCQHYDGIRDLMEMWFEAHNSNERDGIVADLQESLDDIENAPQRPERRPYVRFDDLGEIRNDVVAFKERLRAEVDRQGGISELARRTGIPQSSLSRLFSSTAMPRRTTLFKIAKALNLPETAIGFKWTI